MAAALEYRPAWCHGSSDPCVRGGERLYTGLMVLQEISIHVPVSGGPPGILSAAGGLDGWWVFPATCDPTIRVVPLRGTRFWWATQDHQHAKTFSAKPSAPWHRTGMGYVMDSSCRILRRQIAAGRQRSAQGLTVTGMMLCLLRVERISASSKARSARSLLPGT